MRCKKCLHCNVCAFAKEIKADEVVLRPDFKCPDYIDKNLHTPMKIDTSIEPSHVKALDVEKNEIVTYECYPCPNCGKWIIYNTNHCYCEYCGIRLDWSDEE